MSISVLNLYAGLGGNRKHWKDVEVTAVENDPCQVLRNCVHPDLGKQILECYFESVIRRT